MPKQIFNYYPEKLGYITRVQIINMTDSGSDYGLINIYQNSEFVDQVNSEFSFFMSNVTEPKNNNLTPMIDCGNGPIDSSMTKIHFQKRHAEKNELNMKHLHNLRERPITLEDLENFCNNIMSLQKDRNFMEQAAAYRVLGSSNEYHYFLQEEDIVGLRKAYSQFLDRFSIGIDEQYKNSVAHKMKSEDHVGNEHSSVTGLDFSMLRH